MTVFFPDSDKETTRIHRFEAAPKKPDAPGEQERFARFKLLARRFAAWFAPKAHMADDLAERFAHAEVERRESDVRHTDAEAVKFGAEAVEAAARIEQSKVNAEKAQVEVASLSNKEMARILLDDTLSQEAKELQLLNLCKRDPVLWQSLKELAALKQNLRLVHGASIEEHSSDPLISTLLLVIKSEEPA